MERQLARLTVVQVILIVYAVLAAAAFLKISSSLAPDAPQTPAYRYSLGVKNHGMWMMIVPAFWSAGSFWLLRRPAGDHSTFNGIYITGIALTVFLVAYALRTSLVFLPLFR